MTTMGITVKLLVEWNGYKAGRVLCLSIDVALELLDKGLAHIAKWGEM